MPTFRGYGGGYRSRPRRANQLDLPAVKPTERIPLRVPCRKCGHKNTVVAKAKDYYAVDFEPKGKCENCGARLRKDAAKPRNQLNEPASSSPR